VTREVRHTVERLKFDATHEYRPGVHEEVISRIERRAAGESRVWTEYARLATQRAGDRYRSQPPINLARNDINERLSREFFK
jgi:hypothetical protein